jgi:hypothetical protein
VSTPLAEHAGAEMLRDLITKMLANGTRHAQLRVRYADHTATLLVTLASIDDKAPPAGEVKH